jgi:hypothetical protein
LNLTPDAYEEWKKANANDFEAVGFGGGLYLVRKVNR